MEVSNILFKSSGNPRTNAGISSLKMLPLGTMKNDTPKIISDIRAANDVITTIGSYTPENTMDSGLLKVSSWQIKSPSTR